MDNFVEIPGYPNYYANRKGEIKGMRGGILKPWLAGTKDKKYYYVGITLHDKKIKARVNRLIALTFCPNPNNYPWVDHINQNHLDNNATNLRWVPIWFNGHNRGVSKNSSSGIKGITYCIRDDLWKASLQLNKVLYRKHFKEKKQAIEWLQDMRQTMPEI